MLIIPHYPSNCFSGCISRKVRELMQISAQKLMESYKNVHIFVNNLLFQKILVSTKHTSSYLSIYAMFENHHAKFASADALECRYVRGEKKVWKIKTES